MEIQLERQIHVEKFKAILDIGEKQPRTDIVAVIKIASHHGNQITEKILCDEFIFRNQPTMAKRILKRCQDFGVISEDGFLTDDGIQALHDEKIYHPRTGVYHIWVTKDPLIPHKLLNLELIDEQINFGNEIHAEKRNRNQPRGQENQRESAAIENLPDWIHLITQETNIILCDNIQREVRIEHIEEKVEVLSEPEVLNATVNINDSQSTLELDGLFSVSRPIPEFPSFRGVWEQLISENIQNWDWKSSTLAKSFKLVNENEKKTLRTQERFENPEISEFGTFNSLIVPRIKIEPINTDEANMWANWLFQQSISEYLFQENYKRLKDSIQEKFPKFFINFKSRIDLQKLYESSHSNAENVEIPDQYWYLTAPIDLVPISNTLEERM